MRLILSARDTALVTELVTTTETADGAGNKVYHPQKRDQEHNTDAVRCLLLAIRDLTDDPGSADGSFGGWAGALAGSVEYGDWRAPWS
jgi:hypothetical protein